MSAHFPRITKHDLEVVVEAMDRLREALRADDRELVENLEGLAEKWEKENSLRSDDSYRYPQQLRAVLAARAALRVEEGAKPEPRDVEGELKAECKRGFENGIADSKYGRSAPPSVDGLEAQCFDLLRESSTLDLLSGESY